MLEAEVVVADRGELQRALAKRFRESAEAAISRHDRFSCVLPGGSAAEAFFPALAAAAVDWRHVDFFWGDERAVPPHDADSNYWLAKRLWLDSIPADPVRIHRMPAELADLDAAARQYDQTLRSYFRSGVRFDFVLLGVGAEGHICSLFPHHPALHDARLVVAIHDSPKPPPRRLTLTLAALQGAAQLCVAAFGKEKAAAVAAALHEDDSPLPVALAARRATRCTLFLDPPAAQLL